MSDQIMVYDLNPSLPVTFADHIARESKDNLDRLFKNNYRQKNYYDTLIIVGADDSRIMYPVSDYMQFLMSLVKISSTVPHTEQEANIFQLRVTANINICGSLKSFSIYQNLLTGRINQTDIISKIFSINGPSVSSNHHNMMNDLMNHFYEYTRIIALKETMDGEFNNSHFSTVMALYIGYVLIVLILKYYSMMIKSSNDNKKFTEKILKSDLLITFNKNFPAFELYVNRAIGLMLGKVD